MSLSRYPTVDSQSMAWITEVQMVEVDRVMIEDLGIGLIQMMENAGRNLARITLDLHRPTSVGVAAGSGGNGGGGMVAARHLANAGADVTVTTTRDPSGLRGVPAQQALILDRMGIHFAETLPDVDVVIDAVIGYSLRGAPQGRAAELIAQLEACRGPVISLDTPSGVDVTTGDSPGLAVRADATLTLALPKVGLRRHALVGRLFVADISVPPSVTEPLGGAPDFGASPILELATQ